MFNWPKKWFHKETEPTMEIVYFDRPSWMPTIPSREREIEDVTYEEN